MRKTISLMAFFIWIASSLYSVPLLGQTAASNDEIWPELDVLYRLNSRFRFMGLVSGTKRESEYAEGSFAAYVDYFTLPLVRKSRNATDSARGYYQWFRLGYTYGHSSESETDAFKEHTINMESNTRFHLPWAFLATAKNRFDFGAKNGSARVRYRPRLTVERDCKTEYLTFTTYAYGEYFFDFNTSEHNKFRICLGAELWVTRIVSFEAYYLKQFQGGTNGADINALGVVLKCNFKHRKKAADTDKEPERIRSK